MKDINKIKDILINNFEHYDVECQKIMKYTEEKEPGFAERSKYAGFLKEPVREKQILFFSRGLKNCVDVPRYLFEQIYHMYGQEYTYICVANKNSRNAENLKERITFVKKNSEEFWRALAVSKYLIGNTILPNAFVKRGEQIYINSMTGIPALFQKRSLNVNQHSYIMAEMLKADYLISDSKWMTERIYMEEYQLSGIYGGKIIMPGSLRVSYMERQAAAEKEAAENATVEKEAVENQATEEAVENQAAEEAAENKTAKFVLLIKEKAAYEWMKEHMQELETEGVDIHLVRDYNCCFGGKDICDILAESDVVIGDYSNYLRDAKEYGCKVCCINDKDRYLGFSEFEKVDSWEELKNYVKENRMYRRKETSGPVNAAEQLIKQIFGNTGNDLTEQGSQSGGKKRILFLTEWDLPRKQRNFLRRMVERTDREKYDVIVASPTVPDDYLNQEWTGMPEDIRRICYQGRKVLTEEEYIFVRLMEKKPYLYVKYKEIREALNLILENEWKRRWGRLSADIIVLCGKRARQYFTAAGSCASVKILASEDFMSDYRQENAEEWQKTLEVFDKIYLLPANFRQTCTEYGNQNQKRTVKYKLMFPKTLTQKDEIEHAVIAGTEYLVADKWRTSEEREQLCLVRMPIEGSCILNTELAPDEKRIAFLQENLTDKKCVLFLGENYEAYRPYISCEYRKLEDIVWQELYMLPTAGDFFSRISLYIGDARLEEDAVKDICEKFQVKSETV